MTIRVVNDEDASSEVPYVLPPGARVPDVDDAYAASSAMYSDSARPGSGDRVSLHGVDPLDAVRAMLRTPPAKDEG